MTKHHRPANCEPGSMEHKTQEMGERLRVSRERLLASDLKSNTRAWRLWAACVDATVGYTREADQTYVVGLAKRSGLQRQVASKLLTRFAALGVFDWRSGPRGSHTKGLLTLPHESKVDSPRGAHESRVDSPHESRVAPLHNNELNVMSDAHESSIDIDTQHSSIIGHQAPGQDGSRVEGSETLHQETGGLQREPDPEVQARLLAAVEAELDTPTVAERFAPYHGDERTGEATGDDERAQVEWEADNPAKARARRIRGE